MADYGVPPNPPYVFPRFIEAAGPDLQAPQSNSLKILDFFKELQRNMLYYAVPEIG
jgi:hypothetical protein